MSPELSRGWLPLISDLCLQAVLLSASCLCCPGTAQGTLVGFGLLDGAGEGVSAAGGQQGFCLGRGCPCSSSFPYCRGLRASALIPLHLPHLHWESCLFLEEKEVLCRNRSLFRFLTEVLDWSREGCCSQPCNTQGLSKTCSCARCTGQQKALLRL